MDIFTYAAAKKTGGGNCDGLVYIDGHVETADGESSLMIEETNDFKKVFEAALAGRQIVLRVTDTSDEIWHLNVKLSYTEEYLSDTDRTPARIGLCFYDEITDSALRVEAGISVGYAYDVMKEEFLPELFVCEVIFFNTEDICDNFNFELVQDTQTGKINALALDDAPYEKISEKLVNGKHVYAHCNLNGDVFQMLFNQDHTGSGFLRAAGIFYLYMGSSNNFYAVMLKIDENDETDLIIEHIPSS